MTAPAPDFAAAREAYETARIERDRIIDHPDKSVPLDEYRARIRDAQDKVQRAHGKMLGVRG